MCPKILEGEKIMISANESVLFSNELFKYLDNNFGKKEVEKLWEGLKNTYARKIENLVKEKGLKAMHEYWSKILAEQGGRYNLILTDDEFIIDMHYCPSIGKLLNTHVEPYKDYCGHCPALYVDILEKCGFKADHYVIDRGKGECRFHARKK